MLLIVIIHMELIFVINAFISFHVESRFRVFVPRNVEKASVRCSQATSCLLMNSHGFPFSFNEVS